jgi:maltose O-acetyltransferase
MVELVFEIFTRINRRAGKYISRLKYGFLLKKLGKGSYIRRGVKISGNPKRIVIGSNFQVYEQCFFGISSKGWVQTGNNGLFGVGCYLNASEGRIILGDGVAVGPYCKFYSFSHNYRPGSAYIDESVTGDIHVGDNVFIGSDSVILPGITIGNNSVVAAGSVVTRNVEENTLVGGVPAKIIKNICESTCSE